MGDLATENTGSPAVGSDRLTSMPSLKLDAPQTLALSEQSKNAVTLLVGQRVHDGRFRERVSTPPLREWPLLKR